MIQPIALLPLLVALSPWTFLVPKEAPPPTPPTAADPARVARVRDAMRPLGREARLGPWRVLTDVAAPELAGIEAVAPHLAEAYTARYGLAASPGGGQVVAIFSTDTRYRAFAKTDGVSLPGSNGLASAGLAAFAAGRDPLETRVLFVREATRLLSRGALGEGLPPWLDEGLAADLASCRVDRDGRLVPGTLDGREDAAPSAHGAPSPRANVEAWLARARSGRALPLAAILARGSRLFENPGARTDAVIESAMLVRWCLAEPARAETFREFLRAVSLRGAADDRALAAALGLDEATLSKKFFEWLKTL